MEAVQEGRAGLVGLSEGEWPCRANVEGGKQGYGLWGGGREVKGGGKKGVRIRV